MMINGYQTLIFHPSLPVFFHDATSECYEIPIKYQNLLLSIPL